MIVKMAQMRKIVPLILVGVSDNMHVLFAISVNFRFDRPWKFTNFRWNLVEITTTFVGLDEFPLHYFFAVL